MDKIIVKGGRRLRGTVQIGGSKNAALPIMAAALLGDSPSSITNVPRVTDITTMADILTSLGARIERPSPHEMVIDPRGLDNPTAPYELVRKMRASICVLGPLLGAIGRARISLPGGCAIGNRPIDLHLKGMKQLGAAVDLSHGFVIADGKRMRGADVFLGGRFSSSVLATANVLMAAVKTKGVTRIEGAACEPEVVDLAQFLRKMGARIEGVGSHSLVVEGVKSLRGAAYDLIPDRIEAGTYMIAAAITGGDLTLKGCRAAHLRAVIETLEGAGVSIHAGARTMRVRGGEKRRVVDVTTHPYPGFPTDLQAQLIALMAISPGISVITEKVFTERFMHVPELNRMAACISLEGSSAIVKGVRALSGAPVMASDLRASAALILAGLVARGETVVDRVYHIDRGYEDIVGKLRNVGAEIERTG
ncbi:MAG: UDP-N-acetylglucosamine 1-carboxyvinyltransferase [Candidatus Aureabacteria bacterium]|nr:UDP-N-acetylglucosamine 1-carboxyvinyltransferase [Candidatus Auribacterota bacterium]